MKDRYDPPSEFLRAIIYHDISLSGGDEGDANLRHLIELTRDEDRANRDWATLILAQQELDTPGIRTALLASAEDKDDHVRAEAILGLAQRAKSLALPLLQRELARRSVPMPILEAAKIVGDATLVDDLRAFADTSSDDFLSQLAREALAACQTSQSR